MAPEMIPIDGEEKKRVVSTQLWQPLFRPMHRSSPFRQCYFFDSDVSGFHYGPGHPYVVILLPRHIWLSPDPMCVGWNPRGYACAIRWSWTMVSTRRWRYSWVYLHFEVGCIIDSDVGIASETCYETRDDAVPFGWLRRLPQPNHTPQYELFHQRAT